MSKRYLLWTGHLFLVVLLFRGIWWLAQNIQATGKIDLFLALAAMICLIANHVRWWVFDTRASQEGAVVKADQLMLTNYCILILLLLLIGF